MTTKFTKTEQHILDRLMVKGRYGLSAGLIAGSQGGKSRHYGRREWTAAMSLIRKGLVVEISRHSGVYYRNGYASRGTDLTLALSMPL